MTELVRSRTAMLLIVAAALMAALSNLLLGIGYLTLTRSSESTYSDFATASAWILFGAGVAALIATCAVGWTLILDQRWTALYAVGTACVATLFLTIGVLVLAIQVNGNSNAGNVVAAIGVGIWALLAVVIAARRSISEHALSAHSQTFMAGTGEATYWLVVGGALVIVAVAFGLPGPTLQDSTPGVVAGVLGTLGVGTIAIVLTVARNNRLLASRALPVLVAGLVVYALSRLLYAINSAVVFTPSTTLTSFKAWATVTVGIEFVAWLVIALSAWLRVGELSLAEIDRATRQDPGGGGFVGPGDPQRQAAGVTAGATVAHATPPAPIPPAGWYPDPEDDTRSRWWDGRGWTEHLAPAAPPWPPPSSDT